MIVYGVLGDLLEGPEHYASEREAKVRAVELTKDEGREFYVVRYDLGKIDKAQACRLLDGRGFAMDQKIIWPKRLAETI